MELGVAFSPMGTYARDAARHDGRRRDYVTYDRLHILKFQKEPFLRAVMDEYDVYTK